MAGPNHVGGCITRRPAHTYPFSAIVGQEQFITALLLCAVDPRIGGVLARGEKGTAKSTAARALGEILPAIDVVQACRYGCDPVDFGALCDDCRTRRQDGRLNGERRPPRFVDLPISATEDRLVGTLDLERVLKDGERSFQPGLLADAHRGILYVDEVNLLDDHLVDTLLDVAAMGVNVVEREGISVHHPSRFILIGTMNPEEGDVRPQLLDRFGLCVEIEAVREPESRVEIIRRRQSFDDDPNAFVTKWADAQADLTTRLAHARLRLPTIAVAEELLYAIASVTLAAGVDGHRADQILLRAATANAALDGRSEVTREDISAIASLVLTHRMKRNPFEENSLRAAQLPQLVSSALAPSGSDVEGGESAPKPGEGQTALFEAATTPADAFDSVSVSAAELAAELDRVRRSISGRRQETVSADKRGRYMRARDHRPGEDLDLAIDATVRSAAARQGPANTDQGLALSVTQQDLKQKVRTRKSGVTIVFAVDASGSMGAQQRMEAAKSAIFELLVEAYQRRDRVGLVTFRGTEAHVALAPTASVELANLRLKELPVGGSTPLASGMLKALELLEAEMRRNQDTIPWLVILTDGRANVGLDGGLGSEDARAAAARVRASQVHALLLDTTSGGSGAAREIARLADSDYVRLASCDPATIRSAVLDHVRVVG